MKHFTKQYSSLCNLHGKMYIHLKRKFYNFFLKKTPSITKHTPPFNFYFYDMEFFREFLIQYSLIGIVNLNLPGEL